MKKQIHTMPVIDAFENNHCCCPFCTLFENIETKNIDMTLSDKMMEPDARIRSNVTGFCTNHFRKLLAHESKLSFSLLIHTYLESKESEYFEKNTSREHSKISAGLFGNKKNSFDTKAKNIINDTNRCLICEDIDSMMQLYYDVSAYLFAAQKDTFLPLLQNADFCMYHYAMLVLRAKHELSGKNHSEYCEILYANMHKKYKQAINDVEAFTKQFDYRFIGKEILGAKGAMERVDKLLCNNPQEKKDEL